MARPIKRVVRTKRNDVSARKDVVCAALHQLPNVKVVSIQKTRNGDAQHVAGTGRTGQDFAEERLQQRIHRGRFLGRLGNVPDRDHIATAAITAAVARSREKGFDELAGAREA